MLPVSVMVKSTLVVVAGMALARALRGASAATRHLVLASALSAALALPLVGWVVPALRMEVPRALLAASSPGLASAPSRIPGASGGSAPGSEPASDPAFERSEVPASEQAAGDAAPVLLDASVPSGGHSVPVRAPQGWGPGAVVRSVGSDPGRWALGLWAVVAAALLLRTLAGWVGLLRFSRRLDRVSDPRFEAQRARLGLRRPVQLALSDDLEMPMTWGLLRPRVVLPSSALDWPEARLSAVLGHELAHVERYDTLTQLIASLACALYWPNPLVWLAARQMRREREQACDDRALDLGSRPSDYARSLLEVAEHGLSGRGAPVALAMACRTQLEGRLLAVLDPLRARTPLTRRAALGVGAFALLLTAPLASLQASEARPPQPPAPPTPAAEARPGTHRTESSSMRDGDGSWSLSSTDDGQRTALHIHGKLTPRADLSDVDLAPGTTLDAELHEGGHDHRVSLEADAQGTVRRSYRVDGENRPWDPAWFQTFLLTLDRHTAFAVEVRLPELLRQGGVQAVLREVDQQRGDDVRGTYLKKLLGSGPRLDEAQQERVLRVAGTIDSDYESAGVLIAFTQAYDLGSPGARRAFLDATRRLESDYELGRALKSVLAKGQPTREELRVMLEGAARMHSDYERAQVLVALATRKLVDAELARDYVSASAGIGSDYEHARALKAVETRDPRVVEELVRQAEQIGSDYERATLLVQIAGQHPLEGATRTAYEKAARSIQSDYERGRALAALK